MSLLVKNIKPSTYQELSNGRIQATEYSLDLITPKGYILENILLNDIEGNVPSIGDKICYDSLKPFGGITIFPNSFSESGKVRINSAKKISSINYIINDEIIVECDEDIMISKYANDLNSKIELLKIEINEVNYIHFSGLTISGVSVVK